MSDHTSTSAPPTRYRSRYPVSRGLGVAVLLLLGVSLVACLPPALPTAPAAVRVVPTGPDGATVSWHAVAAVPPVTAYVVTPYRNGVAAPPFTFTSTATTQNVSGLDRGQGYTFTVAARNDLGAGPPSAPSTGIVVGAPGPPGAPTAVPGDHTATITWFPPPANGSAIIGGSIRPYLDGVPQAAQPFIGAGNSRTIAGLQNGATYSFEVSVRNQVGDGPPAMSAPLTIGVPTAPGAATAMPGNAAATVTWSPSNPNGAAITAYTVTPYVGAVEQPTVTVGPATTSHTFAGLANGTVLTFRIGAVSSRGPGPRSVTAAITVGAPVAPGSPAVVPLNAAALVSWTAPEANGSPLTGYVITIDAADCPDGYCHPLPRETRTAGPAATSLTITGLVNDHRRFTFTIAAVNAVGTGPGASTGGILLGTATAPGSPAAVPGVASATVSWAASTEDGSYIYGYMVTPLVGGVPTAPGSFICCATTATITGLIDGTSYTFRVAAVIVSGTGPPSFTAPITVGAPTAPGSPAVVAGNRQAVLTWSAPVANASAITAIVVTPSVGSVAQAPRTFAPGATSGTVTGLTNGVTYTFAVAATNSFGTGPASVTAPATVGLPQAPGTPSAVPGPASATLTWTAPIANGSVITSYIATPYVGGVAQAPQTFASAATTGTVTGLTNGTAYTFRVAAVNAVGTGPQSAMSNTVTPIAPPGLPTFPSAQPGNAQATVSWWPPPANGSPLTGSIITPYIGGAAQAPRTFTTPGNVQVVTGLTNGTTYTFTIAVTNAAGAGPVATTPPLTVGVPGSPSQVSVTSAAGSLLASWTAPAANGAPITGYVITPYVGAVAQAPQTFASTATAQTVTGLTNGTTYTLRIAAINAIGTGASTTSAAVTVGAPGAPGSASAAPFTKRAVISWTAPADNGSPITGYVITPYVGTTAGPAQTFASTATTQTLTGLVNGLTYTFRVAALNARGTGAAAVTPPIVVGHPAVAVSSGTWHSCAVLDDGTAECWGWNQFGQLGDGTTTDRTTPVPVAGLTGITAIAAGGASTCALLTGGTVACWGWNLSGALGDGTTTNRSTPVTVTGLAGVTAIDVGAEHACARLADNTVACWGYNATGELGRGAADPDPHPVAAIVPGLGGVTAISTGAYSTCAQLTDATVRCWGYNGDGSLGDGTFDNRPAPVAVVGLSGVTRIALGGTTSCAILTDTTARCWGSNINGQVGDGTISTFRNLPVAVVGLSDVASIAVGGAHTCARLGDGSARCWGANDRGQYGDGTKTSSAVPVPAATTLAGILAIDAGGYHSCALVATGTSCWGRNDLGQLGDGSTTDRPAPVPVPGI